VRLFPRWPSELSCPDLEQSCCSLFTVKPTANGAFDSSIAPWLGRVGLTPERSPPYRRRRRPAKPVGAAFPSAVVKQDAQGINVCGWWKRLARDLFRAGVIWGQWRVREPRNLGLGRLAILEQLGDAEVSRRTWPALVTKMFDGFRSAGAPQIGMGVLNCRSTS